MTELEPYLKGLGADIQAMQEHSARLEKQLEKRHTYVTQEETPVVAAADGGGKGKAGRVEGYLFKRGQNAFRTWNRRWFYLDSNKVNEVSAYFYHGCGSGSGLDPDSVT
jgi:Arf-GAP/coiled-coil/ANK repeat/PH domain-containing protein